jgi:Zn-dependent protease with chaperone function
MTDSSDSSNAFVPPQQPADSLQTLQAGLAALKQRDYQSAIAYLASCQNSADTAIRLKACIGLIKAYARTEQSAAAILLCQPLCDHRNPQVQSWARQMLAELTTSNPDSASERSSTNSSGSSASLTESLVIPAATAPSDPTGFIPLSQPLPDSDRSSANRTREVASAEHQSKQASRTQSPQRFTPPAANASPSRPAAVARPASRSAALAVLPWRNAGRSSKWSAGTIDVSGLWALQAGTLVLLFWFCRAVLRCLFGILDTLSYQSNHFFSLPRILLPQDFTFSVLIALLGLAVASPWLFDWLLQHFYGAQALSLTKLEAVSPESSRLVKRCGQRRLTLRLLPNQAPLMFSYGWPIKARIAVSQALLHQLNDDEIAALLAAELSHIRYWDVGVMTLIGLVTQLPYLLYWRVSDWGNRQRDRVLRTAAAVVAAVSYGLFWLLRWSGLLLSRIRLLYADQVAVDLTGNPNGLARALLKLTIGTAAEIQRQRQTSPMLESLEMLLPVGFRQAITLGSLYQGEAAVLEWERRSPYRRWLTLNNTHPPLGERLNRLMQVVQRWRLEPEIEWTASENRVAFSSQEFLLQAAPFLGIPVGIATATLLWGFGHLAKQWRWFELAWLTEDESLWLACCLLGFSIGLFLRINRFFPDITSDRQIDPELAELLAVPTALPLDSQPVQWQGILLGRPGLQNWLCQDLLLQTHSGVIRLHYTSRLGWLGDLFPQPVRPLEMIERAVTVTGWFRRGATPWIDVETIQTQYGKTARSYHPVWSTILASVAALLAVYLLLRGG